MYMYIYAASIFNMTTNIYDYTKGIISGRELLRFETNWATSFPCIIDTFFWIIITTDNDQFR